MAHNTVGPRMVFKFFAISTRMVCIGFFAGFFLLNQSAFAVAAGRPIISGGTVKTADGQLLRGCHAHICKDQGGTLSYFFANRNNVIKMRDQAHLNCIRICVITPAWGGLSDFNATIPIADSIVANCEAAGVYAIINYHGTWVYDGTSAWDIRKMWDTYAPRYKDKPFVIYELMNETYQGAPPSGTANDWPTAQNVDIYKNHVRKWAPNNLVMGLLEPVNITANYGPFMRDVVGPACGIDWSAGKDAFCFHAYGGDASNIIATRNVVPTMNSEWSFSAEGWYQMQLGSYSMPAEWFERNNMSWCVWQDRGPTDQLASIMNYLIPDAVAKKYTWWTNTSAQSPQASAGTLQSLPKRAGSIAVMANGRIVQRQASRRATDQLLTWRKIIKMER